MYCAGMPLWAGGGCEERERERVKDQEKMEQAKDNYIIQERINGDSVVGM
ncbi:MAG: hypothetical protein KKC39_03995 [Candidatus Omnitrophica bacterium]|nr:hypothetical protein [Candidatus Omnitrophota bacterium]MCG2708154.1 hypothetical protein [Candidatus Omnitrophota bacterium]